MFSLWFPVFLRHNIFIKIYKSSSKFKYWSQCWYWCQQLTLHLPCIHVLLAYCTFTCTSAVTHHRRSSPHVSSCWFLAVNMCTDLKISPVTAGENWFKSSKKMSVIDTSGSQFEQISTFTSAPCSMYVHRLCGGEAVGYGLWINMPSLDFLKTFHSLYEWCK